MELELTGASYGEKSQERLTQRNGYRDRTFGDPRRRGRTAESRLRKGSYFAGFLEPPRMAEKALTAVVVSTRSVDDLVQAMG